MSLVRPAICLLACLAAAASCHKMYVVEQPEQKKRVGGQQGARKRVPSPKLIGPAGTYRVSRVHGGDLIELQDGTLVRYLGVIAPTAGESYHAESVIANRRMVGGKKVLLRYMSRTTTGLGELLAYVLLDAGQFPENTEKRGGYVIANWAMIRSGSARASAATRHYYRRWFIVSEQRAREMKLGIWQD